jgi:O-acetyl-ADP-ribose deacetylase (regulator of RNase III)
MSKPGNIFSLGQVELIPVLGDITTLDVDAVVQTGGTSADRTIHVSPWALQAVQQELGRALRKHVPFQLGDVIVTHAGILSARYLFTAVVLDWGRQHSSGELVIDEVIDSAARQCIRIAGALGLKSIALTPWGTRTTGTDTSYVTALMVNGIVSQLQEDPGSLQSVYLASNQPEHYKWFVDRAFVFRLLFNQVSHMRQIVQDLDIPPVQREKLLGLLEGMRTNVLVYNEMIGGDKVGGDKVSIGDVSGNAAIAAGRDAQAGRTESGSAAQDAPGRSSDGSSSPP